MTPVQPPAAIPAPPSHLGRLGAALGWLAAAQGSWPPHPPRTIRSLDLGDLPAGPAADPPQGIGPGGSDAGLAAGAAEADRLADAGVDLLTVEGPPATTGALVALCVLLGVEPVLAVGTRPEAGWAERIIAVRDGLAAASRDGHPADRVLTDPALAYAAGLLAQSAARRTPAVLGPSVVVAAAALAAEHVAPGGRRWWLAATRPTELVAQLAYTELVLDPFLDLGLTGTGAAGLVTELLSSGTRLG